MKNYLTFAVCAFIIVSVCRGVDAKDWRGLTPLHSTRTDVEKLLGPPPPVPSDGTRVYTLNNNRSIYFLDEGEIYIVYKRDESAPPNCLKAIPNDTIVFIQVTMKKPVPLQDFPINVERSKQFDPSSPKNIGYFAYIDESAGLMVRTFKGNVEQDYYFATTDDRPPCPDYYENIRLAANIMIG